MKRYIPTSMRALRQVFIWSSLLSLAAIKASAAQTNATAGASAATKAIEVPTSEFSIPTSTAEGRDPFFPESLRVRANLNTNTNATGRPIPAQLVLQGISVVGTNRFALINGRTFIPNEDGEVPAGNGKVHLLCVSIKEDLVIVEVNGNRQELRLRPGL